MNWWDRRILFQFFFWFSLCLCVSCGSNSFGSGLPRAAVVVEVAQRGHHVGQVAGDDRVELYSVRLMRWSVTRFCAEFVGADAVAAGARSRSACGGARLAPGCSFSRCIRTGGRGGRAWPGPCLVLAAAVWHFTSKPVGIWTMRTADSVLLTCCPPAPAGPHGGDLQVLVAQLTWACSGSA